VAFEKRILVQAALDTTLFAHAVLRPDTELDLARAAFLIAEPEYPGLDIPACVAELDRFGQDAIPALGGRAQGVDTGRALCDLVHDKLGFTGNTTHYYDPRNSFLNEVIARRTGIPITLAIVMMEIARRAGVAASGVAFPGHFLVRLPAKGGMVLIDAFHGKLLSAPELRDLHRRMTGREGDPELSLLAPASKSQILLRMLANLRAIYSQAGDRQRLMGVLGRMAVLSPEDQALRTELEGMGVSVPRISAGRFLH
jgi:regulator of sirC expression with transglutaminase-like and TPR domain